MGKALKIIFVYTLPFVLLYVTLGYLIKDGQITNVYNSLLRMLEEMGQTNIWLSIVEYWNNSFMPAWNGLTNANGFFDWIGNLGSFLYEVLMAPLNICVYIIEDLTGILTTLFKFLSFQS